MGQMRCLESLCKILIWWIGPTRQDSIHPLVLSRTSCYSNKSNHSGYILYSVGSSILPIDDSLGNTIEILFLFIRCKWVVLVRSFIF